MPIETEEADQWISIWRTFSLGIVGVVGLGILLVKYWTTGEVSLPAFTAFSFLLGLNSLAIGRG